MHNVVAGTQSGRTRAPNPNTLAGLAASAFGTKPHTQDDRLDDTPAHKSPASVNGGADGKGATAVAADKNIKSLLDRASVTAASPPKSILPPLVSSTRGLSSGVHSTSSLYNRVQLGPSLRAIAPAEEVALDEEGRDQRRKLILKDRELNSARAFAMRGSILNNNNAAGPAGTSSLSQKQAGTWKCDSAQLGIGDARPRMRLNLIVCLSVLCVFMCVCL
jgi:hypothetical protein